MALLDVILADVTAWYVYNELAVLIFFVVNIKLVKYAFQIYLIVRGEQFIAIQTILVCLDLTILYKAQYQ